MKKEKKPNSVSRLLGYAGGYKTLTALGCALSGVAAILGLVPYLCIWLVVRDTLAVFPNVAAAEHLGKWGMEHVAFVFQDTRLFKKSLLENIRAARPDATREQVLAAAHAAQCDDFLEKSGMYAAMWADYQNSAQWKVGKAAAV